MLFHISSAYHVQKFITWKFSKGEKCKWYNPAFKITFNKTKPYRYQLTNTWYYYVASNSNLFHHHAVSTGAVGFSHPQTAELIWGNLFGQKEDSNKIAFGSRVERSLESRLHQEIEETIFHHCRPTANWCAIVDTAASMNYAADYSGTRRNVIKSNLYMLLHHLNYEV